MNRTDVSSVVTLAVFSLLACYLVFRWTPALVESKPTASTQSAQKAANIGALPGQRVSLDFGKLPTLQVSPIPDEELDFVIQGPFPNGHMAMQTDPASDGSFSLIEKMENGESVNRLFDRRMRIQNEHYVSREGFITRSFNDEGLLRSFSWKRADGIRITVEFNGIGKRIARLDEFPNGDKISTDYDQNGNVVERRYDARDSK